MYWLKDAVYATCAVAGRRMRPLRAILMYHDVGGPAGPDRGLFRQQMTFLADSLDVVALRDLPEAIEAGGNVACVTFDDGYREATETAVEVLGEIGLPATFFLPAGLLGKDLPTSWGLRRVIDADGARAIGDAGHEVGAHTISHPMLPKIPVRDAEREIVDSGGMLRALGLSVDTFAYPKGAYDERVRRLVEAAGYRLAVSIEERLLHGRLDRLALPRVLVNETMGMTQFRAKLSGGLELYERLRGRR